MAIKYKDLAELFDMVNFGSPFDHEGYLCKTTGKTYFYSEFGENEEPLPDNIDDESYLMIPTKSELNLGKDLVFYFTKMHLASEYDTVRAFFRQQGAYAKFKSLLEANDKIEQWFQFEAESTEKALRQWCIAQGVELSD